MASSVELLPEKIKMTDEATARDALKYSRFTKDQVAVLEAQALRNDTPSSEFILQLAQEFDAPVKKVADWFVNYKYRKGSKAKKDRDQARPGPSASDTRDGSVDEDNPQSDSKARRFPRLTKAQVKVLVRELANGDSPSRATRERLALEVDAPVQKVSEWFSNRKQRMKKRALGGGGSQDGDGDEDEDMHTSSPDERSQPMAWQPSGKERLSNAVARAKAYEYLPASRSLPPPASNLHGLPEYQPPMSSAHADDKKMALSKVLQDIERSLSELKTLKQSIIAELEEAQATANRSSYLDPVKQRKFEEIHAEVAKMEHLKQKLLSSL
ncbi:hypothetical protein BP5796_01545 [Coleophoma crateriformis]|uniref:Homeobox domain-containing protein n=1 Tax=Coleophoma crateriformis TaxID=565419 RepID=A0A3D8T146_9HELO|nr:hypothetical protein BP5796_01545 [Coleophoma crateriformis]